MSDAPIVKKLFNPDESQPFLSKSGSDPVKYIEDYPDAGVDVLQQMRDEETSLSNVRATPETIDRSLETQVNLPVVKSPSTQGYAYPGKVGPLSDSEKNLLAGTMAAGFVGAAAEGFSNRSNLKPFDIDNPTIQQELAMSRAGYFPSSPQERMLGAGGYTGSLGKYGLAGAMLGSLIAGMNWDLGRNLIEQVFPQKLTDYQKYLVWQDASKAGLTVEQLMDSIKNGVPISSPESDLSAYQQWQIQKDMWYMDYWTNKNRSFYNPMQNEYVEDFQYEGDLEEALPVDTGLYGYGPEEQGLQDLEPDLTDFTRSKKESENMSYRRNWGYTPRRSFGNRGGVSVGRKYVFSRTARPGFYPRMTRAGMRYVKRRTY